MSMISAQIDELRNAAEFYDGFKAANLMRDAADTIWELRDDLQRANAENARLREQSERLFDKTLELATENAKLREERNHWKVEQTHAYSNWEDAHKRVTELEDENAKLRELCGELAGELHALGVDFNRIGWCFLRDELHELGIEVDG